MIQKIRGNHWAHFRRGEWAVLTGIQLRWVEAKDNPRPCFQVVFPDGVVDSWPVYDEDAQWEFRLVEDGES